MQVQIRRSADSAETIVVATEEDAMCKIKESYPDAVSGRWDTDYDRRLPGGRPSGQIKLVYENQRALGRKSRLIAHIRRKAGDPASQAPPDR